MMKPLKLGDGLLDFLICALYRQFPPSGYRSDETPEALYRAGRLDSAGLARFRTWQTLCGLARMEEIKCRQCVHCRSLENRDGMVFMVSMDGKFRSPIIDPATLELQGKRIEIHQPVIVRAGGRRG